MRFAKRGAAVVLASLAVVGAGAVSASASPSTHTLKFTTISGQEHQLGKTHFASTETIKQHGKVIGYDALTGKFDPNTKQVTIQVAVAIKGGILVAELDPSATTTFTGRIISGAGNFAGATGTVHAHSPSESSNKTHVTIHYTLP